MLIIPQLKTYYVTHYSKMPRIDHLLRHAFCPVSPCHHTSINNSDTFFHPSRYSFIYHRHYNILATGNVVKQHKNIRFPYVSQSHCPFVCDAVAWRIPGPPSSHYVLCTASCTHTKYCFAYIFGVEGDVSIAHALERSCVVVGRIRKQYRRPYRHKPVS